LEYSKQALESFLSQLRCEGEGEEMSKKKVIREDECGLCGRIIWQCPICKQWFHEGEGIDHNC